MQRILALDIGGTSIKHGLYNEHGTELEKDQHDSHVTPIDRDLTLDQLLDQIAEIAGGYTELTGIALSTPGIVHKTTRIVSGGGAIGCLDQADMPALIQAKLGLPATIENDAYCATYGEYWLGGGKGCTNVVVLTIGTGIGGGMILNGEMYTGSNSFSAEFGIMYNHDRAHNAQNFSQMASSRALTLAAQAIDPNITNGKQFFAHLDEPNPDPAIVQLYETWLGELARGIFNIGSVIDPDKILLGGGVSSQDRIYTRINQAIKDMATYPYFYTVEPCLLRNDAGKIGAVYCFVKSKTA